MIRVSTELAARHRGKPAVTKRSRPAMSAVELASLSLALTFLLTALASLAVYMATLRSLQDVAVQAARHSVLGAVPSERDALARAYVAHEAAMSRLLNAAGIRVQTGMSGPAAMSYQVHLDYDLRRMPAAFWPALALLPVRNLSWTATIPATDF